MYDRFAALTLAVQRLRMWPNDISNKDDNLILLHINFLLVFDSIYTLQLFLVLLFLRLLVIVTAIYELAFKI